MPAGRLDFTEADLAHSLFSTGRAPGDWGRYGVSSFFEWVHRTSLIRAHVRSGGGALKRSKLTLSLDCSEKVALSHALGQLMTSIFCEQVLGTSYLLLNS